jgi:hypothetical protein
MSAGFPTPEHSADALSPPAPASKPQRVFSCVLCSQRKVKCDRKSPCGNCVKADAQCISATSAPRQRRLRFAERELLDRLRLHEDLLRKHNMHFQLLHAAATTSPITSNGMTDGQQHDEQIEAGHTTPTELPHNTKRNTESTQALYVTQKILETEKTNPIRSFWLAMDRKVSVCAFGWCLG